MSYLPLFRAASNISNPSSYSSFQSCQSLLPIPRVPRIGEEIRSPDEPDRTYSTLVAFTLLLTKVGTGGASIFLREKLFRSKTSLHADLFPSTASACNNALYNGREIHLQISINLIKDSRCTRPKNQHPLPTDERVWRRFTSRESLLTGLDMVYVPLTTAQRTLILGRRCPS